VYLFGLTLGRVTRTPSDAARLPAARLSHLMVVGLKRRPKKEAFRLEAQLIYIGDQPGI